VTFTSLKPSLLLLFFLASMLDGFCSCYLLAPLEVLLVLLQVRSPEGLLLFEGGPRGTDTAAWPPPTAMLRGPLLRVLLELLLQLSLVVVLLLLLLLVFEGDGSLEQRAQGEQNLVESGPCSWVLVPARLHHVPPGAPPLRLRRHGGAKAFVGNPVEHFDRRQVGVYLFSGGNLPEYDPKTVHVDSLAAFPRENQLGGQPANRAHSSGQIRSSTTTCTAAAAAA